MDCLPTWLPACQRCCHCPLLGPVCHPSLQSVLLCWQRARGQRIQVGSGRHLAHTSAACHRVRRPAVHSTVLSTPTAAVRTCSGGARQKLNELVKQWNDPDFGVSGCACYLPGFHAHHAPVHLPASACLCLSGQLSSTCSVQAPLLMPMLCLPAHPSPPLPGRSFRRRRRGGSMRRNCGSPASAWRCMATGMACDCHMP